MDVPTASADVLSQPTRARLFSLLEELARPAGTEELARALGLNVNGVRTHLERLQVGGEVVRVTRGRSAQTRAREASLPAAMSTLADG
jgi:predicted ArsR family transcriptional regulator